MKDQTMVARKTICDYMHANNLKPETININSDLIKVASGAAQKWKQAQEDGKKEKEKSEKDLQMEILTADMEKLKNRCEQIKKTIVMLDKKVKCIKNANKTKDMSFVSNGVALKQKSKETKSDLEKLEQECLVLEAKKKKL